MFHPVLLERLTRKQLCIFSCLLIIIQVVYFMIGGLIASKPTYATNHEFSLCRSKSNMEWVHHNPISNCQYETLRFGSGKSWNDFVYVIQMPRINRWFQTLTSIIVPHIEYDSRINFSSNAVLTYDVRLGYKTDEMFDDPNSKWTLDVQSRESRTVVCQPVYHQMNEEQKIPDSYSCEPLAFLELSCLKYPYYLINLQVVDSEGRSQNLGKLKSFEFVAIYQTEAFTKTWFILKTITFPSVLAALVWFTRQMKLSQRPYTNLDTCFRMTIEKHQKRIIHHPIYPFRLLFLLGVSACLVNLPLDWITILSPINGFQIFSEIRQGFFLTVLLTFWLCFAGEQERGSNYSFWSYGRYISLLWIAAGALLIFELCQRGFQLWNPFHSIWSTRAGHYASLGFLSLAAFSSIIYMICLVSLVARIFLNIRNKQRELSAMRRIRRLMYQGAFYRFQFILLATLSCALLTLIWFCLSQVYETSWVWDTENQPKLHYSGAFVTGVYGMVNIYVFAVLILFSPIISNTDDMDELTSSVDDTQTINITMNQPSAYQMISKAALG